MTDTDRILRAGNFVFGLMDEAERRRAERDLESDAAFREAVKALSERMAEADATMAGIRRPRWDLVSARLAELPQMQGRLSPGARRTASGPAIRLAGVALTRRQAFAAAMAAGVAALILAFCVGYAVGAWRSLPADASANVEADGALPSG